MREKWPSFSIVVETENLAVTEMLGLERCLDSLAAQDPSPAIAQEVLLIESGDTDERLLERLQARFPWLQVMRVRDQSSYYGAKMAGARAAGGDIVLFADSDCVYRPGWIRGMLAPFAARPDIAVVAGETAIGGSGPFALAASISFFFDGYSDETEIYRSRSYYFNNVAFRRAFLLEHPIELDLPLYRGHCSVHARTLAAAGYDVWRQPLARAEHAPPEGLSTIVWRYLLTGRDIAITRKLTAGRTGAGGASGKWGKLARRIRGSVAHDPRRALWLPVALPLALATIGLIYAGLLMARWAPDYMLSKAERL